MNKRIEEGMGELCDNVKETAVDARSKFACDKGGCMAPLEHGAGNPVRT